MRIWVRLMLFCLLIGRSQISQAQTLMAHVEVSAGPPTWSYTLFNDEPAGSPNYIKFFDLGVNAPITVISSPAGWSFDTDGTSDVLWFNEDVALPYPHDIAPGASLSGFVIQSAVSSSDVLPFSLISWDHSLDAAGSLIFDTVLAPSINSVPEASSRPFLGAMTLGFSGLFFGVWRRSRCWKA